MKRWNSLQEMFNVLNQEAEYLVLRNYESLINGEMIDNHEDIDLFCSDIRQVARLTGAEPRWKKDNGVNYIVHIQNSIIDIDIHCMGNGYYDLKWEKKMLENRELFMDTFYILNSLDYFYSLLYHALIHKYDISDDYVIRLSNMAQMLCVNWDVENLQVILSDYMKEKGYFYTYPKLVNVIFNLSNVDKLLLKKNGNIKMKRIFYRYLQILLQPLRRLKRLWAKK